MHLFTSYNWRNDTSEVSNFLVAWYLYLAQSSHLRDYFLPLAHCFNWEVWSKTKIKKEILFYQIKEEKMKTSKIKLLLEKGGMRCLEASISVVENTLDENYKLIKSEKVEDLHNIRFNYEWINRERQGLFYEVSQWERLFRELCSKFGGKEIRANIFACVLPVREEVKQVVKTACEELQKKLNLEASE